VASEQFEVVFICTGNRFRSAIAEALLTRLTEGLPVTVTSAGTLDLGPVGVLPEALELAPGLGVELGEHRARCVRDVDLRDADLVLGFELVHVATAVVDCGAARERSFTLPELVELLPRDVEADGDPREAVRRAHEAREPGRMRELADPLGARPEVFRATAEELRQLVQRLAASLFGVDRARGHEPAARSQPPATAGERERGSPPRRNQRG
jgi:protein-tyrosine-phosphatase